ncbi:P-loop containing nucleoside triphosphate hydrolase protein [Scleroderma yunnanense]
MLNKTIVVLGPTGVGKSSFIRNAVPEGISTDVQVGHHLHSETSQVQSIHLPTQNGLGINLVDTPGFDDSRQGVTDADILAMIAMFLTTQHREGTFHLSGFIYLHRISDTRVGGTSKRNIRIFQKLCGQDSLKNVVIVTTMWDKVTQEEGLRREQELMFSDNLFKPILDGGAILMRHDGTQQSAHDVIKHLFKLESTVPQIVRELVIEKRNLLDTEAGMELQKEVRDVLQKHQRDLQRLEDEIREAIQQRDKRTEIEAVLDRRRVEGDIAKLHGELRKLGNSSDAMDNR